MASPISTRPSPLTGRSAQGSTGSSARAVIVGLQLVSAVACAVASALHAGLHLAIGALALSERPIAAASIVEGAIAVALAFAAWAALSRQTWAALAATGALGFGVAGFVLGLTIVASNPSMQTPFNVGVHVTVLPLLAIGLVLSLSGAGSRALASPGTPSGGRQRVPH